MLVNIQIIQIVIAKKKKIVDPLLIKECTKDIDETELVNKRSNKNECRCSLCTVYKVLFSVFFEISIATSIYFIYRKYVDFKKYILLY